jgi:hypothetical protein
VCTISRGGRWSSVFSCTCMNYWYRRWCLNGLSIDLANSCVPLPLLHSHVTSNEANHTLDGESEDTTYHFYSYCIGARARNSELSPSKESFEFLPTGSDLPAFVHTQT